MVLTLKGFLSECFQSAPTTGFNVDADQSAASAKHETSGHLRDDCGEAAERQKRQKRFLHTSIIQKPGKDIRPQSVANPLAENSCNKRTCTFCSWISFKLMNMICFSLSLQIRLFSYSVILESQFQHLLYLHISGLFWFGPNIHLQVPRKN